MTLHWSEETFPVSYIAENIDFPQLVKVAKTSNGRSCFDEGEVLKLHGSKLFKKAVLTGDGSVVNECEQVANEYGFLSPPGNTSFYRQFSVPTTFSLPFKIVPFREEGYVYPTAGDLVNEKARPKSVIVNKKIVLQERNCVIKEGDILAITSIDKRCTSTGIVDFLICKYNDKTIGLPMSCVGNFTAHAEETLYVLKDLVKKQMDLPQKVIFQKECSPPGARTVKRGGEHFIIPGQPYIIENVTKYQYLVCTKCEENPTLSNTKLIFLPTESSIGRQLKFHLPLFHDIKSYRETVNAKFCANLSIKYIIDSLPIEQMGNSQVVIHSLSNVYCIKGPELPPRKDACSLEDTQECCQITDNVDSVSMIHRNNSSETNLPDFSEKRPGSRAKSPSSDQLSSEEQPLLESCQQIEKTPVFHRKGTSTPCTPENRRRKPESHSWTEKISISLENLKKAFRKAGSEERERSRIGDGSQLADSFENLSVCNPKEISESDPTFPTDYENMRALVAPIKKSNPKPKASRNCPSSIQPSKFNQIQEMWTPPCSPDYRDHSTSYMELAAGFSPVNTQLCVADPFTTELSRSKSAAAVGVATYSQKSPVAAPRLSKDTQLTPSCNLYENIDSVVERNHTSGITVARRCSGYSSGSRESSDGDLVSTQLETIRSIDMIPENITVLTVNGLADCLLLFELPNVANKFRQHQIDGQFFKLMDDTMFKDGAFSFTDFEVLKLKQLRDGWRPRL